MTKNVYIDNTVLKEIKVLDPTFNLSQECNALLVDKLRLLKKDEAPVDPLNIKPCGSIESDNISKQTNLFQYLDVEDCRNKLVTYLDKENDMQKLDILARNCRTVLTLVQRRREENNALARWTRRRKGAGSQ